MRYLFVLCTLLVCMHIYAQNVLLCGAEPPSNAWEIECAMRSEINQRQLNNLNDTITFAIQIHIIRGNNGVENYPDTVTKIENGIIDTLNHYFSPAQIKFYQCDGFDYINDDNYRIHNKLNNESLTNTYNTINKINLYYVDTVFSEDGTQISGFAHFPGGLNIIVIDKKAWHKSTVHEMGHYFYLYHTHENTINGREYANGTNCATAGDLCCDTPADPCLYQSRRYFVNSLCQYTGDFVDPNGDPYNPDPTNLMSYSTELCRTHFTQEQYTRIRYWAETSLRQQFVSDKVFENTIINTDTIISSDAVVLKSTSITNGKTNINYCKEVVLDKGFSIQQGATLTIEE